MGGHNQPSHQRSSDAQGIGTADNGTHTDRERQRHYHQPTTRQSTFHLFNFKRQLVDLLPLITVILWHRYAIPDISIRI